MARLKKSIALAIRDGNRAEPESRKPLDPIVQEARERWNRCDEAEDAQRKSILSAKQFRAGDQWPDAVKLQREGSAAIQGQAAQPRRPCLTIDRLSQPCRQVSNTIKAANFAIDVLPRGMGADDETAELFKGVLRYVQMQSRSESPVEWAADGAVEGGIGWFRLRSDYVHESWNGDPNDPAAYDQELRLEKIVNNLSVYADPAAEKPTRSDAQFFFVTEDMAKEEFKRRWPRRDFASLEDFAATGDNKGWVSVDSVRVAEYWRITYADTTITAMTGQTRVLRTPTVECFKINAVEVLEHYDWLGSRIPLIPILGEELNVNGKAVLRGIIQEGMDAQRMVNYTYSGAMEIFALGNKSPYVVEETQLGPYQQIWQTANTFNYAYLPYVASSNAPPPHRDTSEAPIQAAVQLMLKSEECVKATTGIFDPSLGNVNPQQQSGRAIQSLQSQSDLNTSNYPGNVSRALIYAGELMVELIPKLTRPGQLLHIIGEDDEVSQVLVGQPFQVVNGVPQPSQVTPEQAKLSKGVHQFYDLTQGRYAVSVIVGKSSATKRDEGAQALGQLIPHLPPEMAMVATPDYVRQLSFPGAQKIAERLEKALPPQLQAQEDGEDQIPPQAKAMLQQLQQENQQLKQIVATKQAEQQGKIQSTQIQEQAETQRTAAMLQNKLDVAEISANAGIAEADIKAKNQDLDRRLKLIELFLTQAKEHRLEAETQVHDAHQAAHDRTHDLVLQTLDHQHALEQGQQGHAQALEQGQQAAALAPKPATTNGAIGT